MDSNNNYQQLAPEPNQSAQIQNTPTAQINSLRSQQIPQQPNFSNYPPPPLSNYQYQAPQQQYSPPPPPPPFQQSQHPQIQAPLPIQNFQPPPVYNQYPPQIQYNQQQPVQAYPQYIVYTNQPNQNGQIPPQNIQQQQLITDGSIQQLYCPQCKQVNLTQWRGQAGAGAALCCCFLFIFFGCFSLFACCCEECQDKVYYCIKCGSMLKQQPYQPCGDC
ncbi:hypothetical protein ABPG74_004872 [Tetrahymena malaccensis]